MNIEELEPVKENRIHERSNCKGMIKWSYFNQSNSFDGELLNFSPEGLYFETSKDIKIGTIIFLRFTKYFSENLCANDKELLRNVCLGKVKYSDETLKEGFTSYGVCVKYIY